MLRYIISVIGFWLVALMYRLGVVGESMLWTSLGVWIVLGSVIVFKWLGRENENKKCSPLTEQKANKTKNTINSIAEI